MNKDNNTCDNTNPRSNYNLGDMSSKLGRPLICAPIVAGDINGILESVDAIIREPVDIIEWRIDCYGQCNKSDKVIAALTKLSQVSDKPVICTYRTHNEGGGFIEDKDYYSLIKNLADSGMAGIIDIEVNRGSIDEIAELISYVHDRNCSVITSCHFFEYTPDYDAMRSVFDKMMSAGGDVLKLAVMPQDRHDVMRLLKVTEDASEEYGKPVITISMGRLGVISRIMGSVTGSVMTFASVSGASAPGQLPAGEMSRLLNMLSCTDA